MNSRAAAIIEGFAILAIAITIRLELWVDNRFVSRRFRIVLSVLILFLFVTAAMLVYFK